MRIKPQPVSAIVGQRNGVAVVVAGPPGTGKSSFCGSAIPTSKKPLLICLLERELDSWLYRRYNPDHILIRDEKWNLVTGNLETKAFDNLVLLAEDLLEDETYDLVIVDPGTEIDTFAWRKVMSMQSQDGTIATIKDQRGSFAVYEQLVDLLNQAVRSLIGLAYAGKRPKNVIITWHVQPAKEDTTEKVGTEKVVRVSADHRGQGSEYEGSVLPAVRGQFRRRLHALVPAFVFTDILYRQQAKGGKIDVVPEYVLQVRPDQERHTKLPGKLPEVKYIPNSWTEFVKLLENTKKEE